MADCRCDPSTDHLGRANRPLANGYGRLPRCGHASTADPAGAARGDRCRLIRGMGVVHDSRTEFDRRNSDFRGNRGRDNNLYVALERTLLARGAGGADNLVLDRCLEPCRGKLLHELMGLRSACVSIIQCYGCR